MFSWFKKLPPEPETLVKQDDPSELPIYWCGLTPTEEELNCLQELHEVIRSYKLRDVSAQNLGEIHNKATSIHLVKDISFEATGPGIGIILRVTTIYGAMIFYQFNNWSHATAYKIK